MLTDILTHFVLDFSRGFGRILPYAWGLLGAIAVIELALMGLFWKLAGTDIRQIIGSLILKILGIGFFVFLLQSFVLAVDIFRDSFIAVGLKAGGSEIAIASFLDPSAIMAMGFEVTKPLFEDLYGDTTLQTIKNVFSPFRMATTAISGVAILFGYFLGRSLLCNCFLLRYCLLCNWLLLGGCTLAPTFFWSTIDFYVFTA